MAENRTERVTVQLSGDEWRLIDAIRKTKIANGRIPCVIFMQDGKLVRIEFERVFESVKLS